MSNTFEKSVKGGTKIKLAPPKAKYVEHILLATQTGEAGVAEVFRTLQNRLRDSTWTIVFKALILVHLMVKDGAKDVTLKYLAAAPKNRLALNTFTDVQTQGANIRRYSDYLLSRAVAFADTRVDYCKIAALDRVKDLTVDKGLLRETGVIQDQIRALLKCDFFSKETENDIALMAFRLITQDLLDLYAAMNQAVMNVLSRYFEMSRVDAERAIALYKTFTKQTDQVVQFLSIARTYERVTRLEIPKIKHAPTSLTKSLEEYISDKDFETNRRQYLAAQQARKGTRFESKPFVAGDAGRRDSPGPVSSGRTSPVKQSLPERPTAGAAKGPAPDLIDFFDSIEQQQQPMAQSAPPPQQFQQQPMFTGMAPAQTGYPQTTGFNQAMTGNNPFGQYMNAAPAVNPQYTGIGFGGYGPQPPQQFVQPNGQYEALQQQQTGMQQTGQTAFTQATGPSAQMAPQSTNPFRQSISPQQGLATSTSPPQSTNPFNRSMQSPLNGISEQPVAQQQTGFSQSQFSPPPALGIQRTGTNPFSKTPPPQAQQSTGQGAPLQAIQPMVTGSTNPFRQSMFVNQQTGRGWQTTGQGTMGGLEQFETVPIFPRPGQ